MTKLSIFIFPRGAQRIFAQNVHIRFVVVSLHYCTVMLAITADAYLLTLANVSYDSCH